MRVGRRASRILDGLIGWRGATPAIRARLLEAFCGGIRLRSLLTNIVAILTVGGYVVWQTPTPWHVAWLVAVSLGGLLPRLYALRVRRQGGYDVSPERRALAFLALSAVYGLLWGAGALLLLPHVHGDARGLLLIMLVFGTVMGPYATMPGILYVRMATTGLPTLFALAMDTTPGMAVVASVVAVWLVLRTDAWRGYHRSLRRQLELREALERHQDELERARRDTEQANADLRRVADTDPLTGVANRRHLLRRLQAAHEGGGLMLFDIDRFKRINDLYGHVTGDAVLTELVGRVRSVLRDGDILARLGGDEFALWLPGATPDKASEIGERIRSVVAARVLRAVGHDVRVTVSVGIVVSPGPGVADATELLKAADAPLYAAKRSGRNRVVFAGSAEALSSAS